METRKWLITSQEIDSSIFSESFVDKCFSAYLTIADRLDCLPDLKIPIYSSSNVPINDSLNFLLVIIQPSPLREVAKLEGITSVVAVVVKPVELMI